MAGRYSVYASVVVDLILFIAVRTLTPCPDGMVKVGSSCVDIFEAPNVAGERPLFMQTAHDAEAWCEARGKRLCRLGEWVSACEGTYRRRPRMVPKAGIVEAPGECNNDKAWILPDGDALARHGMEAAMREAERLWQGEPSGTRQECVSDAGVHDTIGNVEEWVSSPDDKHGYALMGHFWSRAAEECSDRVVDHTPNFFYYTTGFRCCTDLRPDPAAALEAVAGPGVISLIVDIASATKSTL